jgi:hypothetical protein
MFAGHPDRLRMLPLRDCCFETHHRERPRLAVEKCLHGLSRISDRQGKPRHVSMKMETDETPRSVCGGSMELGSRRPSPQAHNSPRTALVLADDGSDMWLCKIELPREAAIGTRFDWTDRAWEVAWTDTSGCGARPVTAAEGPGARRPGNGR